MDKSKDTDEKEKANDIPKVKVIIPENLYNGDPEMKDSSLSKKPEIKEVATELSAIKTKIEKGEDQHLYKNPAEAPARAGDLTNESGIEYNY